MSMRKQAKEFFRRGIAASGLGPIVLVVMYLVLQCNGAVDILTVNEVCVGIFSLSALAFVAGGMNVVYQIERLPLMVAILLHGSVLYIGYLAVYLINGWLQSGTVPILVFSVIFVIGYLLIWGIIYSIVRKNTEKINATLKKKQEREGEAFL